MNLWNNASEIQGHCIWYYCSHINYKDLGNYASKTRRLLPWTQLRWFKFLSVFSISLKCFLAKTAPNRTQINGSPFLFHIWSGHQFPWKFSKIQFLTLKSLQTFFPTGFHLHSFRFNFSFTYEITLYWTYHLKRLDNWNKYLAAKLTNPSIFH